MNKEWLSNYAAHDEEEYQNFKRNFKFGDKVEYPLRSRFRKLRNPIVDTTTNIWSLIPFYGSALVHVHPQSRESSIKHFGWGTDTDINNLIQLAKDTGRVQFILDKNPMDYEPFDYLEPIFKEINPPVIKLIPNLIFDKKEYQTAKNEYGTLCDYKFLPHVKDLYQEFQKSELNYSTFNDFSFKFRLDYATLRSSGYDELADKILDSMIDDPKLALDYLELFGVLLTPPKHNSFNISYNPVFSFDVNLLKEKIQRIMSLTNDGLSKGMVEELQKPIFPFELGDVLINKLTLGADGYLGCISLIDKYEQQDMLKLLCSIEDGAKARNVDIINSNTTELSTVLDNLWKDAEKVSRSYTGINFGIPFLFGIIGPAIGILTGGLGGLFAGLGFKVLDKKITPKLSARLTKTLNSDYLVAIYDFKNKYNIKN